MKKFIKKVFIFIISLFVLLHIFYEISLTASTKYNGENTAQQIKRSFRNAAAGNYDCYILGNSRIYRGINPDMLCGVKAYNFAHDNDNYNQIYYKILYLEKKGIKPDFLIVGTDYFQFSFLGDSRNYIYDRLFGIDYMKDYNTSILEETYSDILYFWKTTRANIKFWIPYFMGKPANSHLSHMKDNGQYITYGKASKEDTVKRNGNIMEVQWEYFMKIVEFCTSNNVELYVIMPPTRDEELASYTQEQMSFFNSMIEDTLGERFQDNYLNCSDLPDFKHYSNYTDITHLKEEAADRFSIYLSETLNLTGER